MTLTILTILLVAAASFVTWSLCRTSADSDRDAGRIHQDHMLMRYTGGDRPCVRCGKPTHYTLHGRPLHPECREDDAA